MENKKPWDDFWPETSEEFVKERSRKGRVHNWMNYIASEIADHWEDLTNKEKWLLKCVAEKSADAEEWD